jgi:hypothetical protein
LPNSCGFTPLLCKGESDYHLSHALIICDGFQFQPSLYCYHDSFCLFILTKKPVTAQITLTCNLGTGCPVVKPTGPVRCSQLCITCYNDTTQHMSFPQAQKWIAMYRVSNPRASHRTALVKWREGLDNQLVEGCIVVCIDNQKYEWRNFCLSSEIRGWLGTLKLAPPLPDAPRSMIHKRIQSVLGEVTGKCISCLAQIYP